MVNKFITGKIIKEEVDKRLPQGVIKYLSKYSAGRWSLEPEGFKGINNTVIIPAISEYENIRILLSSLAELDNKYFAETVFIFVINNSFSVDDEIKKNNFKTLRLLSSIIEKQNNSHDNLISRVITSGINIACINASTPGKELPEKDAGAGLARKLGMDMALTLFDYSNNSKKILIGLDADCLVDKNYLSEIVENFNKNDLSAAVINYTHQPNEDEEKEKAITCYEVYLNYYDLGLKFAGSPFAYHTIGSTMACDYMCYLKTGGMNKRKAAEDFYFLQKAAKIYKIEKINSTTVHPASRTSWRVPYGTGPRISRFITGTQNEYLLYSPESFYILKAWLDLFLSKEDFSAIEYLPGAKQINKSLYSFLLEQKFDRDWERIVKNSPAKEQLQRQKIFWFDGFRTLKLIHYLRDNRYPDINMFDALDELFNKLNLSLPERKNVQVPGLDIQKQYLEILRSANLLP